MEESGKGYLNEGDFDWKSFNGEYRIKFSSKRTKGNWFRRIGGRARCLIKIWFQPSFGWWCMVQFHRLHKEDLFFIDRLSCFYWKTDDSKHSFPISDTEKLKNINFAFRAKILYIIKLNFPLFFHKGKMYCIHFW